MLVGAFNQEKALQVAFSGIVQLSQLIVCSTSLQSSSCWHGLGSPWVSTKFMAQNPKSCPVTDVTYFLSWFKRVPLEQKEALVKISIIHIKVQSKQAIDKTARLPVHPEIAGQWVDTCDLRKYQEYIFTLLQAESVSFFTQCNNSNFIILDLIVAHLFLLTLLVINHFPLNRSTYLWDQRTDILKPISL